MFVGLVGGGFSEDAALDMPLDKAYLCLEGVKRRTARRRQEELSDLVSAIGIALSGKGLKERLDEIGN